MRALPCRVQAAARGRAELSLAAGLRLRSAPRLQTYKCMLFPVGFGLCAPRRDFWTAPPCLLRTVIDASVIERIKASRLVRDSFETIQIIGRGAFGEVLKRSRSWLRLEGCRAYTSATLAWARVTITCWRASRLPPVQVHVVRHKSTGNIYAMKILNKEDMLKRKEVRGRGRAAGRPGERQSGLAPASIFPAIRRASRFLLILPHHPSSSPSAPFWRHFVSATAAVASARHSAHRRHASLKRGTCL